MNKIKLEGNYVQINELVTLVKSLKTLPIRTWPLCNLRNSKNTSKNTFIRLLKLNFPNSLTWWLKNAKHLCSFLPSQKLLRLKRFHQFEYLGAFPFENNVKLQSCFFTTSGKRLGIHKATPTSYICNKN